MSSTGQVAVPNHPMVDPNTFNVTTPWLAFFVQSTAKAGAAGTYHSNQNVVALITGIIQDITSLAISAGVCDVSGSIGLDAIPTSGSAWISTTSSKNPGPPNGGAYTSLSALSDQVGTIRITVKTPTQVYLSTVAVFGGLINATGFISARQIS
jgi:hypothetical protein